MWTLIILLAASYWASTGIPGWPLSTWQTSLVAGALYGLYRLACWMQWIDGGHHTTTPVSTAAGHSGGSGGMWGGIPKLGLWYVLTTALMMIGTYIVNVQNVDMFMYFITLGGRSWIYPLSTTDAILWTSTLALMSAVAWLAVEGRWRPAGWIFGITFITLLVFREFGPFFEAIRPIPSSGPVTPGIGESQERADLNAALVKRGALPVAGEVVAKFGFGEVDPKEGFLLGLVSRGWVWWMGAPTYDPKKGAVLGRLYQFWEWAAGESPLPSRAPAVVFSPTPAPAGPLRSCSVPCEMWVDWEEDIKTGGRDVLVLFHGKEEWFRLSGGNEKDIPREVFSPGKAKFALPDDGDDASPIMVKIFAAKK
ncbi:hypothetical protein A2641_03415 [Candidatus Nomurabacteria bacterium RIFCSPHIGHO2_01_FULL_37_25]|uniref:Uncharacterized protein n=1 Tax=Candidatus Nomurabacteria bacterium RIFCSPLOWO2_01_FULL_36_16 TaxID=1801767 RepID=A0A1F6WZP7_9BACT|nr:MAG: hypothetical protein A2641_03415 [Candidatus Nomurabacteria bacterium RIFCSPHIGHO2_01_FULL_37_25]OGI75538.1 MAG: hypothetical protein A3D36_03060 [Candidatus Nomurabacteria bacterium RIFCSPHIGHO2_02_FULL_36_29]OGI87376.1 MAG: hypothetical protein A3A91_02680 [Candidatus Nomurabacteria bacterium RIFCSPLOWO2_01_FULL_36_16]